MLGIGQSATKSRSKFIVYKLTNALNGKSYIGISSRAMCDRWAEHMQRAREGSRNSRLYSAIRKYGPENFRKEILAGAETEAEIRQLETDFIHKFDTYETGYNSNLGGHGFLIFPDHIKVKIGLAQKGKIITPLMKARMSAAKLGDSRCAVNFGLHTQKGHVNPRSRSFLFRFPDGSEHVIRGMREFCRANSLHPAHITQRGHSKGFVLLERLNDHPEREYGQAAGKSGGPETVQNMVCSASKDAAIS
jgi:group I intron endonuclease